MAISPDSSISADRIALLLSVPLTEADFAAAVGTSDWLSKFDNVSLDAATRAQGLANRWKTEYYPLVAQPLRDLAEYASGLKIEVRQNATLLDIRECTLSSSVVILFAHWKGPEILSDDFVRPVDREQFVRRVRSCESQTPFVRRLSTSISPETPPPDGVMDRVSSLISRLRGRRSRNSNLRDTLSEMLTADIPEEHVTSDGVQRILELAITRMSRRRDVIDYVFQGLLQPGNRLELSDGLHTKEETEVAIVGSFVGVLDLTVCTSTVLGDYIAARRKNALRTVQFSAVQELLWGAKCISETLRLVAKECLPYLAARGMASDIIEQAVRQLGLQRNLTSSI